MEVHRFSSEEARRVGEQLGVDWSSVPWDVEQFRAGMDVELEHGLRDPATDVTDDDPLTTGKIALAHLKEFPDHHTRLERMEEQPSATGERVPGTESAHPDARAWVALDSSLGRGSHDARPRMYRCGRSCRPSE